jgi:hypothetical protein
VGVCDVDCDGVPDGETLCVSVLLDDGVCDAVAESVGDSLGVPDSLADKEGVPEGEGVPVAEGEIVIDCVCELVVAAAPVDPTTMMPPMYLAVDVEGPFVSHVVGAHVEATADVPTPNAPTDESPHVSTRGAEWGWGAWWWEWLMAGR